MVGFQYTLHFFVSFCRSVSHVLEYAPSLSPLLPRTTRILKPFIKEIILSKLDKRALNVSNIF
ncbi:hypothetical protein, partial [Lysinibacillus fusiformis]|uniref:hypothetical protein n=1 Tax=Lysinibacillus fusiformis TaxID=28031 RepID=UPI001C60D5A0